MRCQAITQRTERCQQVWRKDCGGSAAQVINGIGLCGTHINALARGEIWVRVTLQTPPELDRNA